MSQAENSESDYDNDLLEQAEQRFGKVEETLRMQTANLTSMVQGSAVDTKLNSKLIRRSKRWYVKVNEIDELKKIFYAFLMEKSFESANQVLNKPIVYDRFLTEAFLTMEDLEPPNENSASDSYT